MESRWQSLQQSADWARKSADQEKAIKLYIQALGLPDVPWETYVDMSMACANSYKMLGQLTKADACLTELAEKASQRGDQVTKVTAIAELLFILRQIGDLKRGLQLGKEILRIAEQTDQPDMLIYLPVYARALSQ